MTIEARLAELGVTLPATAVAPLAVYRPAVRSGAELRAALLALGAVPADGVLGVEAAEQEILAGDFGGDAEALGV